MRGKSKGGMRVEQLVSKKDVANLLKDARARNKMTIEQVAAALKSYGYEIVPKSMYNYESGTSQPTAAMFLVFCRIYGIDDLGAAADGRYVRKVAVGPREEQLLECFQKATPEVQDAAMRVLQPVEKESTGSLAG